MQAILSKLIEPRYPMPEERKLFTNKALVALVIPLVIEQILAMTVGMADSMMVSHAGEAAISGVSLVDMVNGVCLYIFNALATGGAIIVSQYIGTKDMDQSRRAAGQLLMLAVLISGIMTTAIVLGRTGLLGFLFGAVEPDVMEAGLIYLLITAFSYPFMAAYGAFSALFRAMGNSKMTMKVSLGMNFVNVIGNAIGIFVFKAGVVGVAVPTLLSRMLAAVVMFVLLQDKKRMIHINMKDVFGFDTGLVVKILSVAIPAAIQSAVFQVCRVAMTSIIATFGTAQIAANGAALAIDNINTIVNSSVGMALPTVVGRCVGAEDYDQAEYYIGKMLRMAQLGSLVINAVVLLSLPAVLQLYALSEEAKWYARVLVTIHTIWTILLGTTSGPLPTALRAAGDIKFTLIMEICSVTFGRLFFSFVFAVWMDFEIIGMWLAMGTHWSLNSIPAFIRLKSGKWRNRKIV